jgi:hypothetical protein
MLRCLVPLHTADVHGAAFSRDIEPSVEGGTKLYDIMASCVKMFKNGNKGCTAVTTKEPCCIGAHAQHLHACRLAGVLIASDF